MSRRRCVITGAGVISPLGNSPDELYTSLKEGRSGIRVMDEWKERQFGADKFLGAPVVLPADFAKSIPRAMRRSMSNISLYASFAAARAIEEAGLTAQELSDPRTGCIIGSTMGGTTAISEAYRIVSEDGGVENMSSMQFFKSVSHTAVFNVSHLFNITGVVQAPCAACASAVQAIGQARDLIAHGVQDVIVCGGAEELAPEVSGSFEVIYAGISSSRLKEPQKASRPFDAARGGLVCGEGAGIIVLEELEHALKRNAVIYGEIAGYATCCCGTQISQSDSEAIEQCLKALFADAGIPADSVDYINAHATSTRQGDAAEAAALKNFFGSTANPPVSSLKGHLGHTLGASGAIELIASLEMMKHSEIIPTLNLEEVSEDCKGMDFVMGTPRAAGISVILKNSFAFGGINASLLCKKYT